ncbi:hypothetical protein D3C87_1932320 [compost metagenome]
MQLHGAHLHRTDQRFGAVDDHDRLAGERFVQSGHARNRKALGILLKKQLARDAIRRADQRHRAVLELGQNPFGDAGVVLRQLHLGGAAAGVNHSIRVSNAHLAFVQTDL